MRFFLVLFFIFLSLTAFAGDFSVSTQALNADGSLQTKNIFNDLGCGGENMSPELAWRDAPAETKSFAVTVYDPDAPAGGWWHWTLFNIPASTSRLPEGASMNNTKLPQGISEGINDFGKHGYSGPCPPAGDKPHRYLMTVYALKIARPDLSQTTPGTKVGFYLRHNALATASVTGTYGR